MGDRLILYTDLAMLAQIFGAISVWISCKSLVAVNTFSPLFVVLVLIRLWLVQQWGYSILEWKMAKSPKSKSTTKRKLDKVLDSEKHLDDAGNTSKRSRGEGGSSEMREVQDKFDLGLENTDDIEGLEQSDEDDFQVVKNNNNRRKVRHVASDEQVDDDLDDIPIAQRIIPKAKKHIVEKCNTIATNQDPNDVHELPTDKMKMKKTTSPRKQKNEILELKCSKNKDTATDKESRKNIDKGIRKHRAGYPSIQHRIPTETFIKLLSEIKKEDHKKAITNAGFGKLLVLPLFDIPRKLGHWLVSNYDARMGSLMLAHGQIINVGDEDVELCFGLPRGRLTVNRSLPRHNKDVVAQWRQHLPLDAKKTEQYGHKIRHSDVISAMFATEDINEFLQDFLVLFFSCFVEPTQSGVCNQNLVMPLSEMPRVSEYNWCGLLLDCLVDAKEKWDLNPESLFTGPLLFLIFLYMDRVVNYRRRDVPRTVPVFIGWSNESIAAREHFEISRGGFGKGKVEPPLIASTLDVDTEITNQHMSTSGKARLINTAQDFNKLMGNNLSALADIIIQIGNDTKSAPEECNENDVSKALVQTAMEFLGSTNDRCSQGVDVVGQIVNTVVTQSQDPIWTSDELAQVMDKIEAAINKRNDILATVPSNDANFVAQEDNDIDMAQQDMITTGNKSVLGMSKDNSLNVDSSDALVVSMIPKHHVVLKNTIDAGTVEDTMGNKVQEPTKDSNMNESFAGEAGFDQNNRAVAVPCNDSSSVNTKDVDSSKIIKDVVNELRIDDAHSRRKGKAVEASGDVHAVKQRKPGKVETRKKAPLTTVSTRRSGRVRNPRVI